MLKFISKLYNSWQHFGTRMLISKAWEKFVVERYRFRTSHIRNTPNLPISVNNCLLPNFAPDAEKIMICYFLHYFYPDKQGGTERFVLNLAQQQQALGNDVRVITLGKRPPNAYGHCSGSILWEEFDFEGVPITQIRYLKAPRGLYYDAIYTDESNMACFAEMVLERYAPDIVHFAYPQPFAAAAKIFRAHRVPYLITLTDFNMFCHYATMVDKKGNFCSGSLCGTRCEHVCKTYGVVDAKERYQCAQLLLNTSAYITVPSAFVAGLFEQEFPGCPLYIIPHGIDGSFSSNMQRTKTTTFLYAGTLSELKGVHLLIRAFRELRGNITLLIYGGGNASYTALLKRMARGDSRICFCGQRPADQMVEAYKNADCIVVPSMWYETYNFVLREALACGCIGVVSNLGAMKEVIAEGKNGFMFDAGNLLSLREAMEKAMTFNWTSYRQMRFPKLKDESEQYLRLYQQAVAHKSYAGH